MERTWAEGGLVWRILAAWADLRGSMRAELDRGPSEGRLLFYAMLSGAIWSAGPVLVARFGPGRPALNEEEFLGYASALVAGALFLRTLALYGLSAIVHAASRALGGSGTWQTSRAALFWAALVSAPAMVAVSLLAILAPGDPGLTPRLAESAGSLILAGVLAACVTEAQGFASIWRGLGVVLAVVALFLALLAVLAQLQ
jgi:hypothetical protein